MKKIFLYLDESWRTNDSAASILLTEQLGITFGSDEIVMVNHDDLQKVHCVLFSPGVEAYAFIFSDEELDLVYKGVSTELHGFKSEISGLPCQISGHWDGAGTVLIHYMVENLSELDDQRQLLNIGLRDVSDSRTQYAFLRSVGIHVEEMKFHLALAEEYLSYLDALVNYPEFRSKIGKTFDYVFTKINEFYLKADKLKASIMEPFYNLRKVRNENPRAALIVQSIYSGLDFDENIVEGDFSLLDSSYEVIRTFTKSIHDSRQASVAESLTTIMFWVAVISFFFGMIAFYDKYQSSETFNLGATEAFTMTGFILFPFALLFMFVFVRNGVMFEGIARFINFAIVKIRISRLYLKLRWRIRYRAHVVDPEWAGHMEYLTTELVDGLLPQKLLAESETLEGRTNAAEIIYSTKIKPRIRRTYHNLIKLIHWKINQLFKEKHTIKIRSRRQQFEFIVSEICLFTVLNNWLLESNEIIRDSELHFIDTLILHSLYSSWINYFDSNPTLISIVANNRKNYKDEKVRNLTAKYLMDNAEEDKEEEFTNLMQTLCKDSNHEYSEKGDSHKRVSAIVHESIPDMRNILWALHVESYLEFMEKELARAESE